MSEEKKEYTFKPEFGEKTVIGPGIALFCNVFEPPKKTKTNPKANENKRSIQILIEKKNPILEKDPDMVALVKACIPAAKKSFGEAVKYKELSISISDGDKKVAKAAKSGEEKKIERAAVYANKWVLSPKTNHYDRNKEVRPPTPVIFKTAEMESAVNVQPGDSKGLYAGCMIKLAVTPYTYLGEETIKVKDADGTITEEEQVIKGVTFALSSVMKVADGERIGGGGPSDAASDFGVSVAEGSAVTGSDFDDPEPAAPISAEDAKMDETEGFDENDIPF